MTVILQNANSETERQPAKLPSCAINRHPRLITTVPNSITNSC